MAIPTLNLGADATARLNRALADPSVHPDDAMAAAQQYQQQVDQNKATHSANIAKLDTLSTGFKADQDKLNKSEFGVKNLGYVLNDPNSSANLTKLAPLAIAAGLTPFTGGLSLAAASGIIGAGTGATEIARQSGNGEAIDPLKAGTEGVKQGAMNFVGGKVLEGVGSLIRPAAGAAGTAAEEVATQPNFIQKAGNALRQSVTNPRVSASVGGPQAEQDLAQMGTSLGLKGSASNQYSQLKPIMSDLNGQITPLLESNTGSISKEALIKDFEDNLLSKSQGYDPDIRAYDTYKNHFISTVKNASEGDTLSASDLYKLKKSIGAQLPENAFDPDAVLNPKQDMGITMWNHVDNSLTDLAPEVKALTQKESTLYRLAPGLKAARDGANNAAISVLGAKIPLPGSIVQAGKDAAGTVLQGAGGVPGAVSNMASSVLQPAARVAAPVVASGLSDVSGPALNAVLSSGSAPSGGGGTTAPSAIPATPSLNAPTPATDQTGAWQPGQPMSRQQYSQLMTKDLAMTGGRFGTQITAAFQSQNPDVTTGLSTAANAIGTLSDLYTKAGGGAGLIAGNIKNAIGSTSYGEKDVKTYNDNANALGQEIISQIYGSGGSASDRDQVLNSIPKITDSKYEAERKIGILKALLSGRLGANQNSTAGQINNQLSAPSLNLAQ